MATAARVLEFDVTVDRDRTARSGRGGAAISPDESWAAEHLVLAGLVRCTLASLDYSAARADLEIAASGRASGNVTKREGDGRYAFVSVDVHFEVALDPGIAPEAVSELLARAETGCFVGNSLIATPHYHWTVNGKAVA
ncbi:hypothetical protein BH20ACT13_BH20ACT13_11010 [soil metagenome]